MEQTASSSYKTKVVVKTLAAARTGAEITNLLFEAGQVRTDTARERLMRIDDGLSVFTEDAPREAMLGPLRAALNAGAAGDDWVRALDSLHDDLTAAVQSNKAHPQLPLVLAGAWLQASWLTSSALERAGAGPAHELLYHPDVGHYFQAYIEARGSDDLPNGMVLPLKTTLSELHTLSAQDPMPAEDVTKIRASVERILGAL